MAAKERREHERIFGGYSIHHFLPYRQQFMLVYVDYFVASRFYPVV